MSNAVPGGTLTLAKDLTLPRMGFGTMRLRGTGEPDDPHTEGDVAVLHEAVDLGIRHIDTAAFYGHDSANRLIRRALQPYRDDLHIVTKVGWVRDPDDTLHADLAPESLVSAVHANLDVLEVDALDVVNLRMGTAGAPEQASLAAPFAVLAELQQQGKIRHLGVSNVTAEQVQEAVSIAPVVCVQNQYNLAQRGDDALVDWCAERGIGFVPFFPLGGFSPLQSRELDAVAEPLGATPLQVALAWLLHRSPTILLIPGTSSVPHLRENVAAADLSLSDDVLTSLAALAA